MRAFRYVPESDELKWDRIFEGFAKPTVREAESDAADLVKDETYSITTIIPHGYRITGLRRGIPERYSNLYDAPRPA